MTTVAAGLTPSRRRLWDCASCPKRTSLAMRGELGRASCRTRRRMSPAPESLICSGQFPGEHRCHRRRTLAAYAPGSRTVQHHNIARHGIGRAHRVTDKSARRAAMLKAVLDNHVQGRDSISPSGRLAPVGVGMPVWRIRAFAQSRNRAIVIGDFRPGFFVEKLNARHKPVTLLQQDALMLPRIRILEGATNFRDLGGYPGLEGRRLRWRQVFRSDHLGGLTPTDLEVLAGLGVARTFDFRGARESAADAYDWPGLQRSSLAIEPTMAQRMNDLARQGLPLTRELAVSLMTDLYQQLINEQHHRFAELFETLRASDAPVVFHCTAGKDRTGVAAALLLLALGTPKEVIERDYLLTNDVYRLPAQATTSAIPADVLQVLWGVRSEYLNAALHALETTQGGTERYMTERLGLTPGAREQLAQRLLEDAPG